MAVIIINNTNEGLRKTNNNKLTNTPTKDTYEKWVVDIELIKKYKKKTVPEKAKDSVSIVMFQDKNMGKAA
jgi:cytochrome oxidase Cu insertion factor (SCO1/SenC/PrrC family)